MGINSSNTSHPEMIDPRKPHPTQSNLTKDTNKVPYQSAKPTPNKSVK